MLIDRPNLGVVKLAAYAAMVADHFAVVCAPELLGLRFVGRLALPWFVCSAGYAFANLTRDGEAYTRRLALFGVACQPVYSWVLGVPVANVLLTLSLGLLFARVSRPSRLWALAVLLVAGVIEHAAGVPFVDGGFYAVAAVASAAWGWWPLAAGLMGAAQVFYGGPLEWIAAGIAEVAVVLFVLSSRIKWRSGSWSHGRAWYWFYPLHLAALYVLAVVFG